MPPWESYGWFDTPTERVVTLAVAPAWTQLCGRSVRRVVLVLATTSQTTVSLSMSPGNSGAGFVYQTSQSPLIWTQKDHAVLCQEEWWAKPGSGLQVTVIEVLLRAWPGGDPIA